MPVKVPDPCAQHNLWFAHSATPSADGRLVYVVCGCGRRRSVPAPQWQAEAERRQEWRGKEGG